MFIINSYKCDDWHACIKIQPLRNVEYLGDQSAYCNRDILNIYFVVEIFYLNHIDFSQVNKHSVQVRTNQGKYIHLEARFFVQTNVICIGIFDP